MRERVRIEARSALGAGEAGRADHQTPRSLSIPQTASKSTFASQQSAVGGQLTGNCRLMTGDYNAGPCPFSWDPSDSSTQACWAAAAWASSAIRPRSTASSGTSPTAWRPIRASRLAALFGPQHGFRSDVQENMIETGHGRDEIRRVPVYSLYSETREPTAEMLRERRRARHRSAGRRHPHLHLHLHDGQLPARRAPARRQGDRVRPAESDRRRRGRGTDARARVRVVRRAVSHPDAARDDDRRARAPVQRAFRHRRRPRGRDDGGLASGDVFGRDRPAVGDAVAEHPDPRQRHRLSRHGAVRGNERLGRTRNDAPVRAGRRAVDGGRALRGRDEPTRAAGRPLPAGRLRADVPQAREDRLRRLSDPRARSRDVPRRSKPASPSSARFRAGDPGRFAWREPPYEYEHDKLPIDILAGSAELREQIDAGRPAREIARSWERAVAEFDKIRRRFLLY